MGDVYTLLTSKRLATRLTRVGEQRFAASTYRGRGIAANANLSWAELI